LFLQLFLLASNRFAGALPGTSISFGFLAANRQATTVAKAAVTTKIHESLDIGTDLSPQITLDLMRSLNYSPDFPGFNFRQVVSADVRVYAGFSQDLLGQRAPDAVDVGKRYLNPFISR
jgi:hypothetical protein